MSQTSGDDPSNVRFGNWHIEPRGMGCVIIKHTGRDVAYPCDRDLRDLAECLRIYFSGRYESPSDLESRMARLERRFARLEVMIDK